MKTMLLVGVLLLTAELLGQSVIPAGTVLPLRLNSSLSSKKSKPADIVTARLMQDILLPSGEKIHAGSKAVGHVLEVIAAKNGGGAKLSLQFDTIEVSHQKLPMTTNLRALASMMEVEDAQTPKTGPDRGTSQNSWTTVQVGGDVVYRGGGPVARGLQVVGTPTADGVLVRVASKPGTNCRGDLSGHNEPQALWVFSADACGTYGFSDLKIVHAARSCPIGQITLASDKDFNVRGGSGILLRVK
jgi:hypothetical protein